MNENPAATAAEPAIAEKPAKKEDSFPVFVLKLALIVVLFRSFVFAPFYIPSESMLPRLLNGDYLLISKWSYGFSSRSLPFGVGLLPDSRVLASVPDRGDVVVFKAPPLGRDDWIKRVIGLPGDTIQMQGGQLWLNGKPIPKQAMAPFEVAVTPNTHCLSTQFEAKSDADGIDVCRYPRFKETLPEGKSYEVLDLFAKPSDDTAVFTVPAGHVFLMGDNRDNSEDSRFPAEVGGGIGFVPIDNLIGRATVMMWSTDGGAEWIKPWTWFTAARWSRIGGTF